MDKNETTTLNVARFVMMLAVLFLHCYTSVQMYQDIVSLPVYARLTRVLSWQFGELGVPTFFVISGYLFFNGYQQTLECYISKIKRRFHSLLIPYVFWTLSFLILFYIIEYSPMVCSLFNAERGLVQDYTCSDFLRAFWAEKRTSLPFLIQLWYVRNLMIMVAFAPLVYLLIKRLKHYLLFILGVVWFFGSQWYSEVNTLYFFFFGAWFSINGKSLIQTIYPFRWLLLVTFLCFAFFDLVFMYYPVNIWLHRAVLMLGSPVALTVIYWMVKKGYVCDIKFLSASSFFVYVAHDPMLRFIRKFSLKFLNHQSEVQMILDYFASIALDLLILYGVYWLLSKYTPKFLSIISGGRG